MGSCKELYYNDLLAEFNKENSRVEFFLAIKIELNSEFTDSNNINE